jgi:hypothetical protein
MKIQKTIGRKIILTPETYHDEALLQSFLDGRCKFMVNDKTILVWEGIKPETAAVNDSEAEDPRLTYAKWYEKGWHEAFEYVEYIQKQGVVNENLPPHNGFGQDINQ